MLLRPTMWVTNHPCNGYRQNERWTWKAGSFPSAGGKWGCLSQARLLQNNDWIGGGRDGDRDGVLVLKL